LWAHVLTGQVEFSVDLIVDFGGDANSTRLSDRLQSCSYIDAVSKDVVRLDNYVPNIDTDPENNAPIFSIAICNFP
jgi:hypothetical protein